MGIILIIYFISLVCAFSFLDWACERDISIGGFIFVIFCPILNTVFAIYRIYRCFKSKDNFFLKDLFEK